MMSCTNSSAYQCVSCRCKGEARCYEYHVNTSYDGGDTGGSLAHLFYQDEEDKDFVVIELEEEDEYNDCSSRSIELHKSDIELLIKRLKSLV